MSLPTGLRRRAVAIVLAAMVAGFGIVATSPESATAASKCTTMRRPIHQFLHRTYGVSVLTSDSSYYPVLKKAGYVDLGVTFKASGPAKGLSAVHELWNPKSFDRIYSRSATEIAGIKKAGYVDRGVAFYAASSGGSCLSPVYRFHKGSGHLYVGTAADRAALKSQGWTQQSAVFWLAKPSSVIEKGTGTSSRPPTGAPNPTKDAFTIAVMPDTQQETLAATDTRFADRTHWLVDNRAKLGLKFVTHVGDVVNWDTPNHDRVPTCPRCAPGAERQRHSLLPQSRQPRHGCGLCGRQRLPEQGHPGRGPRHRHVQQVPERRRRRCPRPLRGRERSTTPTAPSRRAIDNGWS